MKVVILAGGYGTRLSEYTDSIPKPMVNIGEFPIIWHIMKRYAQFGHKNFYLALGYKADVVKKYFLNYTSLNSDFSVDLSSGKITYHQKENIDWMVTMIQTGLNSMTGGRLKRLKRYIGNETFMLTYGDGVSDIDLDKLLSFHRNHKKMVSITAVRPNARFGELEIEDQKVISFKEKPQTEQGWVNGGYFIVEPEFIDLIEDDSTILEKDPLEKVAKIGQLMAYRHEGFWQCMDTKRDKDHLDKLWLSKKSPWNKL